jgi:hypothetical protein
VHRPGSDDISLVTFGDWNDRTRRLVWGCCEASFSILVFFWIADLFVNVVGDLSFGFVFADVGTRSCACTTWSPHLQIRNQKKDLQQR